MDDAIKRKHKENLEKLVERFSNNYDQYKKSVYNETEVRVEFINKFFECFGWDVDNNEGLSETYKDVVNEYTIQSKDDRANPDYAFRVGGTTVFFVEAKKPSENIKHTPHHAYQLKRYAWNDNKPLSILTDFEEFAIYDCRKKPMQNEKASHGRIIYVRYDEYISKFDLLWNIFSKEAVLKGNFERYANANTNKKGTSAVDSEFLNEMKLWRKQLAKNISLRNKKLVESELNNCVQKTIDRIIFLRICEDKNIEPYEQLKRIGCGDNVYSKLCDLYDYADDKYNSGLFNFDRDTLTKNIKIDNKVIRDIIKNLYYPDSPYNFSVLSVSILGKVYEEFLGQTIRLSKSQVKIEEKPGVRSKGGVYYTPKFVVEYIVKNTVGKLINNKTPQKIEKIRILDPACGSGAFLLQAYHYLLQYHLDYYSKNPNKFKKVIYKFGIDKYHLSIQKRKEILLNNIFGIDVDSHAVEITKLSLLLKVLENETKETIHQQKKLFAEKALPDLENNIRCGNSLVNSGIFGDDQYDDESLEKIRPFNWDSVDKGFGHIINSGGFDAIIGNPPYIKEDVEKEIFAHVKATPLKKYYMGKMDYWHFFTHKSLNNLRDGGYHSFVTQNSWINSDGAKILRKDFFTKSILRSYVDFNEFMVFDNASIQTSIFICVKKQSLKKYQCQHISLKSKNITIDEIRNVLLRDNNNKKTEQYDVVIDPTDYENIRFVNTKINDVLQKIMKKSNKKLNDTEIESGMDTLQETIKESHLKKLKNDAIKKGDGVFVLDHTEKNKLHFTKNELKKIKPFYTSKELGKYYGNIKNKKWIIYADSEVRKNIKNYPNFKKHLDRFKPILTSDFRPYGLNRPRNEMVFQGIKLIALRMTKKPAFTYSNFPSFVSRTFIIIKSPDLNIKYLTGLFNSKLSYFILYHIGKRKGNQLQIDKTPLIKFPIYVPNSKSDEKIVSCIDKCVDKILDDAHNLSKCKINTQKQILQNRIEYNEKQIDIKCYELYGLTNRDVNIIENM